MFRKGIKFCSIIVIFVSVLFLSGCETKQEVRKNPEVQQLNLALQSINTLDPAILSSSGDFALAGAIFEGLVRANPDGTMGKALAKDWLIENDGTRYTFYLRDAWWTSGKKVTAHDFEYAWKRALDPGTKSPYPYLLYDIKNAENYNRSEDPLYTGNKAKRELIAIKAVNDNTLVVELKETNTSFLIKLAHPVFYPLPSSLENAGVNPSNSSNITGNGPFKITEYSNESVELSKNEKYWDEENVRLSTVKGFFLTEEESWELFNKGDLDLIFSIPQKELKKGLAEGTIITAPLLSSYYYDLNTVRGPLADKRIRQALSYAIDRNYLVDKVLQGGQNAAQGIIPAIDEELNSEGNITFNLEAAKNLITEAGYAMGEDVPALQMLIREGEGHEYLAFALKEQWKVNLGIEVIIASLKWEDMSKRLKERDFDVALQGLAADYSDYLALLDRFIMGSGNNYTGWTSLQLNEEIKKLKTDDKEDLRRVSFLTAERYILEDMPILPVYNYTRAYALKNWVHGVYISPAGLTADFKWTYIE